MGGTGRRAERRKQQVCSKETYDALWARIARLPATVEHLVVQLGIPIAYPRMNFMECVLFPFYFFLFKREGGG